MRRSLVSATAEEVWKYLSDNYGINADIPDLEGLIDYNIGWNINDDKYEFGSED